MIISVALRQHSCAGYLCSQGKLPLPLSLYRSWISRRAYADATRAKDPEEKFDDGGQSSQLTQEQQNEPDKEEKEEGALTRRLWQMSHGALESGGSGARKAVEEAGFSAELKVQLEQRIAAASLRLLEANTPLSVSQQTRDLASGEAWTGTESLHDASLRMLKDAHKPVRLGRSPRAPGVQMPKSINTGHKRVKEQRGVRLANARDRSGLYSVVKGDPTLDAADRERQLQEMKDRFEPGARAIVPGSIQGLTSLANQRIEDAIARGQFRNIPRGKGLNVERDHNANSPFIDTTEYFMNKIIQKQEIVPPWIEKQQELTATASKFRGRLRAEWRRHAARMISSQGGSLQDQLRRAEAFAQAELIANPLVKKKEVLTDVDSQGRSSQITLSGALKMEPAPKSSSVDSPIVTKEIVAERASLDASQGSTDTAVEPILGHKSRQTIRIPVSMAEPVVPPAPFPFRDPEWERIENGYHIAALKDLNDKCRSYNLQAPELAKRPYFSLQRELNSCYGDIAPQLAQAILDRAQRLPQRATSLGHGAGEKGLLGNLVGDPIRIRDERTTKQYGFKQFWKDLWAADTSNPRY